MSRANMLIYGFGPYDRFDTNVTEAIISLLQKEKQIVTKVFDTRFDRTMFLDTLKRYQPSLIIGLGQHPRARKLRLERKAVNLWGKRRKALKPIAKTGPSSLFVNFSLPNTQETTVTYDAGTYVCNFSMYVCLEYCKTSGVRFAFIHVPSAFDPELAATYIRKAVKAGRFKS